MSTQLAAVVGTLETAPSVDGVELLIGSWIDDYKRWHKGPRQAALDMYTDGENFDTLAERVEGVGMTGADGD